MQSMLNETNQKGARKMSKVTAIVYGGKIVSFTDSDLRELLTHPEIYMMADNLPKWLMAVAIAKDKRISFKTAYGKAVQQISEALESATPTEFNVRSDY